MKRLILAYSLILWLSIAFANPAVEGSITGISTQDKQQEELSRLEKLASEGIKNPDLYYNIGVMQYQLGKPGMATLYYLKALTLDSAHRQAKYNLRLLQELQQTSPPSHTFLIQLMYDILDWLNNRRLAIFILISLVLSVLGIQWLIHLPSTAEKGPPVLFLSLSAILLIGLCGILIIKQQTIRQDRRAVITIPMASTYQDEAATMAAQSLPEATVIHILESKKGITRARLGDGSTIWIKTSDFIRIKEGIPGKL